MRVNCYILRMARVEGNILRMAWAQADSSDCKEDKK